MVGHADAYNGSDRQNYAEEMQVDVAHPVMVPRAPSLVHEDSFSSSSSAGAVIAKGPSQATTQVIFSTHVVPSLVDSLMNPVAVNTGASTEDVITLVNVCYVGGWYPGTSNEFIINILQKCGKITHFKRHTDPSNGVVANFAFCDFDSPGGAYYAMNCLSGLPFGSSNLKVRCSDHVKANIEAWKQQELADIKKANYGMSDEAALEQFKSPEEELKNEFTTLMRFEVADLQKATYTQTEAQAKYQADASNASGVRNKIEAPATAPIKPKGDASSAKFQRAASPSRKTATSSNGLSFTSREYTIHPKEADRMSKLKQKKRGYDDRFRQELKRWLQEEESLFGKLQRVGKVKQSTRERLVRDDLHGRPASNPKARRREREMDAKDAQAEAAEVTTDSKMTVAIQSSATGATTATAASTNASAHTAPKVPLANVFASADDDDDEDYDGMGGAKSLFTTSRHRPFVPLGDVTDDDIWKLVPKQQDAIYAFNLDWDTILADGTFVQLLEPWIKICIVKYMGQDENDEQLVQEVIEFITGRLQEKPKAQELLQHVHEFLDEESQGFVLELWKRLIFQHFKLLQTNAL